MDLVLRPIGLACASLTRLRNRHRAACLTSERPAVSPARKSRRKPLKRLKTDSEWKGGRLVVPPAASPLKARSPQASRALLGSDTGSEKPPQALEMVRNRLGNGKAARSASRGGGEPGPFPEWTLRPPRSLPCSRGRRRRSGLDLERLAHQVVDEVDLGALHHFNRHRVDRHRRPVPGRRRSRPLCTYGRSISHLDAVVNHAGCAQSAPGT